MKSSWPYILQKKIRYNPWMSKLFRFPLILLKKAEFKIPHRIYKHFPYIGVLEVVVDNKSFKMKSNGSHIENALFWAGLSAYESESINKWIKLSEESDIIFDIGANSGIYSLISGAANENAEIYAFEPIRRISEILKINVSLNPKFNINIISKAVSHKNGNLEIYDPGGRAPTSASLSAEYMKKHIEEWNNKGWNKYKVPVKSLDCFKIENNLEKVDLIKMDVEGHEAEVIKGMENILRCDKPLILMESLDKITNKEGETILRKNGYKFFKMNDSEGRNLLCKPVST